MTMILHVHSTSHERRPRATWREPTSVEASSLTSKGGLFAKSRTIMIVCTSIPRIIGWPRLQLLRRSCRIVRRRRRAACVHATGVALCRHLHCTVRTARASQICVRLMHHRRALKRASVRQALLVLLLPRRKHWLSNRLWRVKLHRLTTIRVNVLGVGRIANNKAVHQHCAQTQQDTDAGNNCHRNHPRSNFA